MTEKKYRVNPHEQFRIEMEKRRIERQKVIDENKFKKHYFPEMLLNKYSVKDKILDKLPYMPRGESTLSPYKKQEAENYQSQKYLDFDLIKQKRQNDRWND